MNIQRISAFSQGSKGGNPAGVLLLDSAIDETEMKRIAAEVGYSETAFAVSKDDTHSTWQVRYFSPQSEVPFCGHATIALGAALGKKFGVGKYNLILNDASITVEATNSENGIVAKLSSPPTKSQTIKAVELNDALALFGFNPNDLDTRLAPARIHGGSDHLMLALKSRSQLRQMSYDLNSGREVMNRHGLVTIMLVYIEDKQTFVVRNAFASGGVLEDPATGAAAAAFAGYLRDQHWPHNNEFIIRQGEDMGQPSLIEVALSDVNTSPISVSGLTRAISLKNS